MILCYYNRILKKRLEIATDRIGELEKKSSLKKTYITGLRNHFYKLSPHDGWASMENLENKATSRSVATEPGDNTIPPPETFSDSTLPVCVADVHVSAVKNDSDLPYSVGNPPPVDPTVLVKGVGMNSEMGKVRICKLVTLEKLVLSVYVYTVKLLCNLCIVYLSFVKLLYDLICLLLFENVLFLSFYMLI